MTWDVLDLGPTPANGQERWGGDQRIRRVIRLIHPAPSGRRLGSRVLGLGLDALLVALRARFITSGPLIAMNPWTTVAARVVGFRDVSTIGLYAVEGGRSWRFLRAAIGDRPVITLSEYEASRWRAAGGRAGAVRYGATFPDTVSASGASRTDAASTQSVKVFIGGSSDRDSDAIKALISEIESKDSPLRLTIAVGDREPSDDGRVRRLTTVTADEFSELLSQSDIVFLPLADNGRAAGHMVLVEALQRGKPVVATWVAGMDEYFDGEHVIRAAPDLVGQLVRTATAFQGRDDELHRYWRLNHSKEIFGAGLLQMLQHLHNEDSL